MEEKFKKGSGVEPETCYLKTTKLSARGLTIWSTRLTVEKGQLKKNPFLGFSKLYIRKNWRFFLIRVKS